MATFPDGSERPVRIRKPFTPSGESRTHTAFTEECNLPAKIHALSRMGKLDEALRQPPLNYGDFSNVDDYMSALMAVKHANASFLELPAKTRLAFNNSPAELLAAIPDPSRREELISLGVIAENPPVERTDPVVSTDPVSAPPTEPTPQEPPS